MTAWTAVGHLAYQLALRYSSWTVLGYGTRHFSTEPTCLALLTLRNATDRKALTRHVHTLVEHQRPDSFWPDADQDGSTSVWAIAIALNSLIELSPRTRDLRSGLHAILDTKPQEAIWIWPLKFPIPDRHVQFDPRKYGWGWVPGTISWVNPTTMAVISLERSVHLNLAPSSELKLMVELGQAMLLDHVGLGGWDAGNNVVYGVVLAPHIDVTAIKLATLRIRTTPGLYILEKSRLYRVRRELYEQLEQTPFA